VGLPSTMACHVSRCKCLIQVAAESGPYTTLEKILIEITNIGIASAHIVRVCLGLRWKIGFLDIKLLSINFCQKCCY
jgi:hypothetical protein